MGHELMTGTNDLQDDPATPPPPPQEDVVDENGLFTKKRKRNLDALVMPK